MNEHETCADRFDLEQAQAEIARLRATIERVKEVLKNPMGYGATDYVHVLDVLRCLEPEVA
jgi:hypothetical protein